MASKALEDLGYNCIDNMPVELLPAFFDHMDQATHAQTTAASPINEKQALVLDARNQRSITLLPQLLEKRLEKDPSLELVFLDAKDEVLMRRFSETRHRHPLSPTGSVDDGILKERELLSKVRNMAHHCIDTSDFSSRDLRHRMLKMYSDPLIGGNSLKVTIMSFGYKYGVPLNSDLVMDVRFLKNPYFEPALRVKTGLDQDVQAYVMGQEDAKTFVDKLSDWARFLLPRYQQEGKSYLQISIGCTGGQHRSVAIAQALQKAIRDMEYDCEVLHRQLESPHV